MQVVPAEKLGKVMKDADRRMRQAINKGAKRAAWRGKDRLIKAADDKKIRYRKRYQKSFRIRRRDGNWAIVNEAPQAGIIELGTRPHPVSEGGIKMLERWAKRTLGIRGRSKKAKAQARGVAEAIARDIQHRGQKGRYVFRDELDKLARYWREETVKQLRKAGAR